MAFPLEKRGTPYVTVDETRRLAAGYEMGLFAGCSRRATAWMTRSCSK
jgi:hypothetical protein